MIGFEAKSSIVAIIAARAASSEASSAHRREEDEQCPGRAAAALHADLRCEPRLDERFVEAPGRLVGEHLGRDCSGTKSVCAPAGAW